MIYNILSERLIYPIFDLVNRHSIMPLYRFYMKNQWKDKKNIENQQIKEFKKLVKHAYLTVPYYRKLFEKHKIKPEDIKTKEDILKIPILTREDLNKHFNELLSAKVNKRTLSLGESGGSTGKPIKFYQDTLTLDSFKAIEMRFYSMMGIKIGDRIVRMWGTPRDINKLKTLKMKIYNFFHNRLFLDGFDLSEKTIGGYVTRIKRFKPKLIFGYVQCIDMLAQYIEKHKIKGIKPKAVFTTSSVLYPPIRKRIEKVLGCQVYNEYGSCETGPIADECKNHRGLHINTETCFVEFIKDGRIAKPGEPAELVITVLTNYSMPLIRYKIEDLAAYTNKKCKCGRGQPIITDILGRTFGVFTTLNGDKVHGYYFTNRIFMQMKNVKQFNMIQKTKKDYLIKIVRNPGFGKKDVAHIENMLKHKLGKKINIQFEYLNKIYPESSGKYLYTKSYVK